MNGTTANARVITKLMFRLLPIQVLLAAAGAVNGIVSGFFASNFVGVEAMGAIGLFSPIRTLLTALSVMLAGGSAILCGKYMGRNEQEKMQNVFSLDLVIGALAAAAFTVLFVILGGFGLTGSLAGDENVGRYLDPYLLGQAIGVIPLVLGGMLPVFLSLENMGKRTMRASLLHIAVNLLLNILFVLALSLGTFGLALASSLGAWAFLAMEALPFLRRRTHLRLTMKNLRWGESRSIAKTGVPWALSSGYQTVRGLLVNRLILLFVGSVGISALAAADNLLSVFWAIPTGMLTVSRLLMSVCIGEEDRQSLTDVMRVMFRRFLPLMCAVCACIMLCAEPLTGLFYSDSAGPVYRMTVWGLRILPVCMPLRIVVTHFAAYGQASGKQGLAHALTLLEGLAGAAGFAALLIPRIGMNGVYIAHVLGGAAALLCVVGYAWRAKKGLPRDMDELMVIPADFGASEEERLDLTVRSMEEVVSVSRRVQAFCLEKGIDLRRAYLAGLSMEEMAGNIVRHGFGKDGKSHSVDVRVVHKDRDVILRLKDDCAPFDPGERQRMAEGEDVTKNIGIRMVFRISRDVRYQCILGLNVLTIRI